MRGASCAPRVEGEAEDVMDVMVVERIEAPRRNARVEARAERQLRELAAAGRAAVPRGEAYAAGAPPTVELHEALEYERASDLLSGLVCHDFVQPLERIR